jgi:hypothetical protein
MNVQPVIPIPLTKNWNLITRTILPIINQPPLFAAPQTDAFGIGDLNPTFFFSPNVKEEGFLWGVGPTIDLSHRERQSAGRRQIQHGSGGGGSLYGGPVGGWCACEPAMVGRQGRAADQYAAAGVLQRRDPEFGPDWQLRFQLQFLFPRWGAI